MTIQSCSCIIPFHNESERIISVLEELSKVSNLSEIVCVDDGSTDNGSETIKKMFPDIKIVKTGENMGKSGAVAKGLNHVNGEYVLLMDADLSNLKAKEIENGIDVIVKDSSIDMIIFRRKYDPFFSKVVRGDVLVSGERILRTSDLKEIFEEPLVAYQIEPAINYYMQELKKNAYWKFHSGKNVMKIKKIGVIPGLTKEFQYFLSVLTYKGPIKYLENVMTFCRDEAR